MPLASIRIVPLVVATALFMETMDATIIATALPTIARDLGIDPIALKVAITSYLVGFAILVPVSGWIADRYGARNTFRVALAIFMAASIGCATANSLLGFVLWRFVQGLGGAMMTPVGRLVIVRGVPKDQLVTALSTLTIPSLIGPVIGPPLGGFIVTVADWRWIFFVNIPIGLLGIVLATIFFKDEEHEQTPLDIKGFLLCAAGLPALIMGAASFGRHVAPTWVAASLVLIGLAVLTAYVRHARRTERPLLNLRLLDSPTYSAGVVGGAIFRIGAGASAFLVPLMLQLGFGFDALTAGLIMLATAAGALSMKFFAPRILSTFAFRKVLVANALVASAAMGAVALTSAATPYAVMMALLLAAGFVRSLQFSALHAISYADVEPKDLSAANSLASVGQQVSLSFGVAVGAGALEVAQRFHQRTAPAASDFSFAIMIIALVASLSVLKLNRLPADAGRTLGGKVA